MHTKLDRILRKSKKCTFYTKLKKILNVLSCDPKARVFPSGENLISEISSEKSNHWGYSTLTKV